jgi:bacillithiol system protein YtxJ
MFEFLKPTNKNDHDQTLVRVDFEAKEQWSDLIELSHKQAVYIFKHSSRCGISSMVLSRFEKQLKERKETYFHLHIQGSRSLSNWLAEELMIRHESPQLIVLKDAKVLANDSHYALLEVIEKL